MDPLTIFQRTESGRDTIKTKSRKLTQSERLLLIIINGVTPYDVLRKEVWSLSEDRFDRALRKLLKEDLIEEVLLPVPGQEAEELDSVEIDRFLQQDPLDPVTIISFDPEDEFGADMNPFSAKPSIPDEKPIDANPLAVPAPAPLQSGNPAAVESPPPKSPQVEVLSVAVAPEERSAILNSLSIQLAQDKAEEISGFSENPAAIPTLTTSLHSPEPDKDFPEGWPEHLGENIPEAASPLQWVYWIALVGGIGIIVSSLILNATR